jgi:N-acetylglucosaminyldiphosphoundecaprenol N-acetyl-beta-D-mannosaminyltransferase
MNAENITILDIPFTTGFEREILDQLRQHLFSGTKKALFVATPNPEMLLECRKNLYFKKILQQSDLNLPDGNGLIWAHKFLLKNQTASSRWKITLSGIMELIAFAFRRKNEKQRFQKALHGSDLTLKICQDPELSRHGVFLLGNRLGLNPNTADLAGRKLRQLNPHLHLAGTCDATPADTGIIKKINDSQAEILFVAFGAPHQELWLAENLPKLPGIKLAMGVGGTFDFIAGILPRAPLIFRKTGFEWLYRLIKQPRRFKRILNATLVFPYVVIRNRLANPDRHKTSGT